MKTCIAVIIAFGLLVLLGISIPIGYYAFLGKSNNETEDENTSLSTFTFELKASSTSFSPLENCDGNIKLDW